MAERKERKKETQKALKKRFWPKRADLLGRKRGAEVEVVESGIGC